MELATTVSEIWALATALQKVRGCDAAPLIAVPYAYKNKCAIVILFLCCSWYVNQRVNMEFPVSSSVSCPSLRWKTTWDWLAVAASTSLCFWKSKFKFKNTLHVLWSMYIFVFFFITDLFHQDFQWGDQNLVLSQSLTLFYNFQT